MAVAVTTSAIAFFLGIVLLACAYLRVSFSPYRIVMLIGTLIAAAGAYGGGAPTSGAQFFYVWLIPFAFAFSAPIEAAVIAASMAASYGIVLILQFHIYPGIGSSGLLFSMWLIVVATEVVVGIFVRRFSRSLRESDQRFEQAFDASPVGAAFLSPEFRWVEINDALCQLLGRERESLIGQSILEITHPDDRELTFRMFSTTNTSPLEFECRCLHASGGTVWVTISVGLITPEAGAPYFFSQVRDITEHKLDQEMLAHRAIHDPLTGLFNRALLIDRLTTVLRRDSTPGRVGVIFLDLDHFKLVNDSLGHRAGDEVLSALAPRLAAAVHPSDTLARFGGDEFVIMCDDLRRPLDAVDRADRIAAALAAPLALAEGSYVITASIGVAVSSDTNDTADVLIRDADAAMYRAKATGRNRIEIFDRSMRDEATSRLQLEHDMREPNFKEQLEVVYQPVVNIDTGLPVMLEALVRWNHPTNGLLLPDRFIPLAEENGLINEIGAFVLSKALGELSSWQAAFSVTPPIGLTVNVSSRQFEDPGFSRTVAEVLRSNPVAPGSFGIELTESLLMEHKISGDALSKLKDLGVVVLLDDFGTGYSSLAYLERFPIDILKIDKSFVERVEDGPNSAVVLGAILAMARALDLAVIAEGVHHDSRLDVLRELGFTLVQGNAISLPLPGKDVPMFLEERRALASAIGDAPTLS